jgi:sulfur-oxidizing protein SoxY
MCDSFEVPNKRLSITRPMSAPARSNDLDAGRPSEVEQTRRDFIRVSGIYLALVGLGLLPGRSGASGWDHGTFNATTLKGALAGLGGVPEETDTAIQITLPEVVEDGAVVPVSVSSAMSKVEDIFILVESNPFPLAVAFRILEGTEPSVSVRLKLAQSGVVHAVVRANGRLYSASKGTRVTVGGCT